MAKRITLPENVQLNYQSNTPATQSNPNLYGFTIDVAHQLAEHLESELNTIDIEYVDVTNQKILPEKE